MKTRATLAGALTLAALCGVAWAASEKPTTPDGNGRTSSAPTKKDKEAAQPNANPPKAEKPERFEGDATSSNPTDDYVEIELWFDAPGEPVDWVMLDPPGVRKKKLPSPSQTGNPLNAYVQSPVYPPSPGRYRIRARWYEWTDTNGNGKIDKGPPNELSKHDDPNTPGDDSEVWGPITDVPAPPPPGGGG